MTENSMQSPQLLLFFILVLKMNWWTNLEFG